MISAISVVFLIVVVIAVASVAMACLVEWWIVSSTCRSDETDVSARPIITPRLTSPPPPARTSQTVNNSPVYSVSTPRPTPARQQESGGGDGFVTSAVIGAVTNNGLLGGFVGGNFAGGMIGDAIVDGSIDLGCSHSNDSTPSYDSPSVDYSSSSDSFSGGTDFGGGDF